MLRQAQHDNEGFLKNRLEATISFSIHKKLSRQKKYPVISGGVFFYSSSLERKFQGSQEFGFGSWTPEILGAGRQG
jgi:hypothetical protein